MSSRTGTIELKHDATSAHPHHRRFRLVRAELLKLRRRRGLGVLAALLAIAPMAIGYGIGAVLHSSSPAHYGPAGGVENLAGSLGILITLAGVAAMLLGVTAGGGDLASGVFRELVITGRSRRALFAARIPAGLALVIPMTAAGFAVAALASTVFAGPFATPDAGLLISSLGWVELATCSSFVLALGVSSLVGSRAASIAGLLAWQLAISPLVLLASFLGVVREAIPSAAVNRLEPAALHGDAGVSMSLAAAIIGIAAWLAIPLVLGAWRTITREA